jgi:hypothetical protein
MLGGHQTASAPAFFPSLLRSREPDRQSPCLTRSDLLTRTVCDTVASHFSSIGLPLRSEADLHALIDRLGPSAEPMATDRGTYFRWCDPSGAEVWLQVSTRNEVLGANPHFTGESVVRVQLTERPDPGSPSSLDGRFHGWADPVQTESGEVQGAYPFLFDAPVDPAYSPLRKRGVLFRSGELAKSRQVAKRHTPRKDV